MFRLDFSRFLFLFRLSVTGRRSFFMLKILNYKGTIKNILYLCSRD